MAGHRKQYSFDEKKDAEYIINNGFKNGFFTGREALVVAKYYREKFGYGVVRLERSIIDFCKKNDPSFNEIIEAESIYSWVKNAMKYKLHKPSIVSIRHSEMNEIKKIKSLRSRKVLFISLVLSKSLKSKESTTEKYYLHYGSLAQVATLLDFKIKEMEVADVLSEFIDLGLIGMYSPEKESMVIKFASDTGAIAMRIDNPEKAMEHYRAFFGGDVIYCANGCGKEIVKTSNRSKYCEECALKIKREKDILRINNNRKSVRI